MSEKNWGDKPDLDEELDRLQARLPQQVSRFMKKVRSPEVAPYRIPAGIALTAGGLVRLPADPRDSGWCRSGLPCWRRTCR